MRLREGFIVHNIADEYMAVATGEAAKYFNGIVRNNETAAYIFELLQQETTEEEIVDAMCQRYEVERNVVKKDVKEVLQRLMRAGFLCEI